MNALKRAEMNEPPTTAMVIKSDVMANSTQVLYDMGDL